MMSSSSLSQAYMKLHQFRQDLQDYQDNFIFVSLYPVDPVDPVIKIKMHFVKIPLISDRTLAVSGGAHIQKPRFTML